MNLNLLFDFLITEAKEKSLLKKIENVINSINKVVINKNHIILILFFLNCL